MQQRERTDVPDVTTTQHNLPRYDAAMALTRPVEEWSLAGFPGSTLADIVRIVKTRNPNVISFGYGYAQDAK